jgi:MFS family permease
MKAIVAVVIGNWLEFYDFLVFSFFAVMIGDAFFPGSSEIVRLLGALATFGVGFVTRPLGAAVIGAYADRAGRRAALTLTLVLMSIGSVLAGVTPTYARIGLAAPILLVIARLIQGFSCGGEVGPATTYLFESAPPEKRAALTAWQGYSQQLAIILGSLIGVALAAILSAQQLHDWGWRIPFLLGAVIFPVALYIRRQLPETIDVGAPRRSEPVLRTLMHRHAREVALGVLVVAGGTISTYVFTYMTTYAITTLHLSAAIGMTLNLTGALGAMAGMMLGAWIDRFGRKPMLIASRVVFLLILYPAYVVLVSPQASSEVVVAVNVLLNFVFSIGIGALYAFLTDAFPQSVRASGLAILYALGTTIFGGTTQFVVAWLIDLTGNPMMPGWYQMISTAASIVGVVLLMPHREVVHGEAAAAAAKV